MQLYYHPISSNARRVLLAADHLGIQLDLVEVSLMSEADRRRIAEVNDNGKIPVLVDDAVAAPLMYQERARLPLDGYPHLAAWFARVQDLPAWRNTEAVW